MLAAATLSSQVAQLQKDVKAASAGADACWMLVAGVIVFFMQSGFALLESGTVRFKNNQNVLLKNCMDACIGGIVWWLWGFGFAYGNDGCTDAKTKETIACSGQFIGKKYFFGTDMAGQYGNWYFQYAFACTAATIVSGSLAERVNINNYLLFSFMMTGFTYPLVANWTWGQGWLAALGYTDFAGSGVVHLVGGAAGFIGTAIMGPRLGYFEPVRPGLASDALPKDVDGYDNIVEKFYEGRWTMQRIHVFVRTYDEKLNESDFYSQSPQQVVLGTLILWLAWLLFNGGSTTAIVGDAGEKAALAMVNTIIAPSASGIATFIFKKPCGGRTDVRLDFSALTNGILAGLVGVTASCDDIEPWAAFVIGFISAFVYIGASKLMQALKVDDPLEATQVHGFCGAWGVIAVAFFQRKKGIFYGAEGSGKLLGIQCLGVVVITAWSMITCGLYFAISNKLGLFRLSEMDEILGGDIHYFGPIDFTGKLEQYDLESGVEMVLKVDKKKDQIKDNISKAFGRAFTAPQKDGDGTQMTAIQRE